MQTAHEAGILPSQHLQALIDQGAIRAESAFDIDQVQPASAWRRTLARPDDHHLPEAVSLRALVLTCRAAPPVAGGS